MSTPDFTARQFPTAFGFALRNQARNRLAWLLLAAFVPAWYGLMAALMGNEITDFRLYATGTMLHAQARPLGLISAGLNSLTLIVGFAVFAAVRRALPLDRRLVFAGFDRSRLIGAKALATVVVAVAIATYASVILLVFWRPPAAGWAAVVAGYAVMAIEYGALGLLLGVLVRGDLEGFFLIIMGGLTDTFLQNPVGNPAANKALLAYFPSFGPMQFATGGALADRWLIADLALGLAWAAGFALLALLAFAIRTRRRR